jgi:FixJ family two-component response regulator
MDETLALIVVVEDDASMSVAIERLLRAAGLCAQCFSTAEKFLASSPPSRVACFIFDIELPGLSGFELCARLAASGNTRPVIFMTAYDLPAYRERAADAGGFHYFTKPFPGRNFIETVQQAASAG